MSWKHVGSVTRLAWCEVEENSLEKARRNAFGRGGLVSHEPCNGRACSMASRARMRGKKGPGKARLHGLAVKSIAGQVWALGRVRRGGQCWAIVRENDRPNRPLGLLLSLTTGLGLIWAVVGPSIGVTVVELGPKQNNR